MKYVLLSHDGWANAFYDDHFNGARDLTVPAVLDAKGEIVTPAATKPNPDTKIPADATPITDELWQAWVPHTHSKILVNGALQDAPAIRTEMSA